MGPAGTPSASSRASQWARRAVRVVFSISAASARRCSRRRSPAAKRSSAHSSGRPIARARPAKSLSLLAPTVNQPSLARSAWYGAASRWAEPSAFGVRPVAQY
jgi:hypothetical protein